MMSKRVSSAEISSRAADWAVRVDAAPLDTEEEAMLVAWLAEDERHLGAFARARAILIHTRRARSISECLTPEPPTQPDDEVELPAVHIDRRRFLRSGMAAVAVGLVTVITTSDRATAQNFRTGLGEIRLLPLDDGSSMTLNTSSEVQVAYNDSLRSITLVRGEAFFDVTHDPNRPFIVMAGGEQLTALGTSFGVRKLDRMPIEVVVRQGEVMVVHRTAPQNAVTVKANARAVAVGDAMIEVTPLAPAEISRTFAWREGMLAFEDMALSDAATEFARYSNVHIAFANSDIAAQTITGLYAANDPIGFAKSAARSLGFAVEIHQGTVLISN